MYTPESRQKTLEKIVDICRTYDDIEGVLLVGSGGTEFPDKWADIDLSIVVNPASRTKNVWDTLNHKFRNSFEIITLGEGTYGKNNYISILILKDYLEVDAGVISLDNLEAKKDSWKILYEKQDKILNKMHESRKGIHISDPVPFVRDRVSVISHYVRTFGVAINRNQPFRAVKELEDIRNMIAEIWATKNMKVVKHFRDIDEADSVFRNKLASTFPINLELNNLKLAFNNAFDLFFELAVNIDEENQETILIKKEMEGLLISLNLG